MSDTNYTPDEVRLMDLCAASWVGGLAADSNMKGYASEFAAQAYSLAAAMIAERRKRVGANPMLFPQSPTTTAPIAQPEPEQAGELTEEAVDGWDQYARFDDGYWLGKPQIDRAVALMREGLAAKQTAEVLRHKVADLQRTVEQGADDLRAADESITRARQERDVARRELGDAADQWRARAEKAEKERDEARAEAKRLELHADAVEHSNMLLTARAEKAEAALAEAQPVLDAVAEFGWGTHEKACLARELLANYADRRREQAKGAS